jgi:prophage regulatory protein
MMNEERMLRLKELIKVVGLSRSTIYALIANNKFPKPIHLTPHTSVWRLSVINSWIDEREAATKY